MPCRSLSVVLVLDLSAPASLWATMETLLQVAQAHVEQAASQARLLNKSRAASKHSASMAFAARVLPKDFPVSPHVLQYYASHTPVMMTDDWTGPRAD